MVQTEDLEVVEEMRHRQEEAEHLGKETQEPLEVLLVVAEAGHQHLVAAVRQPVEMVVVEQLRQ
jgi:hypothetical protein